MTTNSLAKQANGKGNRRGLHPNSLANLEKGRAMMWKKGQSGNPKGRIQKEVCLTSQLKEEILKVVEGDPKGRTWMEILVQTWLRQSLQSPAYFKELLDRVEGKPVQPIDVEGIGPIIFRIGEGPK